MRNLAERVLHTLAQWGVVVEHKKDYTNIIDDGQPQTAPDLKSERFVFSVSYIIRKVEFISEYWFETKRGKRVFTVYENHHVDLRVTYRADLKSFLAHFSHKFSKWVHASCPTVVIPKVSTPPFEPVDFQYHSCDFSKCRYAFNFNVNPDTIHNLVKAPAEEVIAESYRVLGNSLTSKIPEINEILTGVPNDGELTSPRNCPLVDNLVCRICGHPVFAVPDSAYIYECIHHGEIDFLGGTDRVDPKTYKDIYKNCLTELERFCECPQD